MILSVIQSCCKQRKAIRSLFNVRVSFSTHSESNVVDQHVSKLQIERLLIANRGEIACRIIRTARRLGIETVAVFSDADRKSMHVAMADQAYHIGPSPAIESYLVKEKLIKVAQQSHSDAIHPGYGFLSENFEFAALCSAENIKFVGPSADSIKSMGIKSLSKSIMIEAGVPVIPGYHNDANQEDEVLQQEAARIGYPVMIKAVRGGGGKGMRIARSAEEFLSQLHSARREAMKSFGDQVVLLEKFVSKPRHIEVQIFGDQHGNCVHLFERDCSSQRRHQKVIEEAPAPHISSDTRQQLGMAAVRAAKAVKYEGAGTVEFIYDTAANKFYFMEMNTRLQVEHPVTEMVTGLDLVEWQLRVASGEPLPLSQSNFNTPRGHAFEARIYAEDAENNFMPCTGLIESLTLPDTTTDIRIETGVRAGDEVSVFYDPMIAKLVVWAPDRQAALMKLRQSLNEYRIAGLKTNIDYLIRLASHPKFDSGKVYTDFISEHSEELQRPKCTDAREEALYKAIAALSLLQKESSTQHQQMTKYNNEDLHSPFGAKRLTLMSGYIHQRQLKLRDTQSENTESTVNVILEGDSRYTVQVGEHTFRLVLNGYKPEKGLMKVSDTEQGVTQQFYVLTHGQRNSSVFTKQYGVFNYELELPNFLNENHIDGQSNSFDGSSILSPMPAVVEKITISAGDTVRNGDTIAILTAMKMEHIIKASFQSNEETRTVEQVFCKQGDSVPKGAKIVQFVEQASTVN